MPEQIKQKSADESTDDSKRNIEPETLPLPIDDLASDKPGDQAEYDPADDAHCMPSSVDQCIKQRIAASAPP
jgi:hypothetical protein